MIDVSFLTEYKANFELGRVRKEIIV